MRGLLNGVLSGAILMASAGSALAQSAEAVTPELWLLKMSEAARTSNYVGTVTYRGDGLPEDETFRVTHRFHNGIERERVRSLTGEPREVETVGDKTICLLPQSRKLTVERPTPKGLFPGLTPERLRQVAQVYQFDDLGEKRVAGRLCRGIAIIPRDDFRYGYEVWADSKTAVPLKMDLRDGRGRVLEQMMFAEIEFPASIADSAFSATPAQVAEAPEPPAPPVPPVVPAAPLPPMLATLPPGFHVTLRDVRQVPGKGLVEHWLLSDGLSAISVFTTRRASSARGFQGIRPIGALNAYGRVSGRLHITVVGEVPPQTVKMVGDGLKDSEEAPSGPKHP